MIENQSSTKEKNPPFFYFWQQKKKMSLSKINNSSPNFRHGIAVLALVKEIFTFFRQPIGRLFSSLLYNIPHLFKLTVWHFFLQVLRRQEKTARGERRGGEWSNVMMLWSVSLAFNIVYILSKLSAYQLFVAFDNCLISLKRHWLFYL